MGALRVVVYVEGAGEGASFEHRAPGDRISEESFGSAHLLILRCIEQERSIPANAIVFEEPLRTRGRIAKGSDLSNERILVQLLTWPSADRRPDLVVVVVDCDGELHRRERLAHAVAAVTVSRVIGMAIQELESWLLADQRALAGVLGRGPAYPGPPESLAPGDAKRLLAQWGVDAEKRRDLARTCDLKTLATTSTAFERFLVDLRGP